MIHIPDNTVTLEDLHALEEKLKEVVKRRPALRVLLDKMPLEYRKEGEELIEPLKSSFRFAIAAVFLVSRTRPRGKRDTEKEALFVEAGEMYKDFARQHNRLYIEGRITKEEWITRMRQELKDLSILSYAAGLGDWPTTASQWGKTGAHIRTQYGFLSRFADNLENMTLAQMNARAAFYANGARPMFEAGVLEGGTKQEFNSSWLPALPAQRTECKMNCKCYWAIKKIKKRERGYAFHWVVTWTLREAKHCATCVRRSNEWRKVKVFPDGFSDPPFQAIDAV